MRISDWSSDVCSSDLLEIADQVPWSERITKYDEAHFVTYLRLLDADAEGADWREVARLVLRRNPDADPAAARRCWEEHLARAHRSEEHTSELQSLMRISYAVFCLKKKTIITQSPLT